MKRQDYVFGSTTSNIEEQTPEALNNGWVELSILYSRVLNGVCAALSQSTNIVSQEVANAIVGMGVTLNPASDNQLLQVLQKLAIKATDFESPITASNKGATMKEIEEVVTSSFRFKGYVSTTQPTDNLVVDNLWINLSNMPSTFPVSASLIKKWDGSAWVNYGSAYTPMNFDAFRNNNDNEGYYWFGGQWKLLSTDLSTDYFRLNQTSGKWEIKNNVNLPGTPTVDTPSSTDTRAIANVDFVLNNSISSKNFTNCLTEIPQDIKLELNNGTLTLKAGSKVYVPNGPNVFNLITIQDDIATTVSYNGTCTLYYAPSANQCSLFNSQADMSGTTDPTTTANFYNTEQNLIKRFNGSVLSYSGLSFPLCRCTTTTNGVSSIDVVFNGFGYIGSTIFALPGVKGLIPNDRNADGTLNNTEFVSTNVVVRTLSFSTLKYLGFNGTSIGLSDVQTSGYDKLTNTNRSGDLRWDFCIVGVVDNGNGIFSIKQPFVATDYNDFENAKQELNAEIATVDSNAVHKTGAETIDDVKTFLESPIVPTPDSSSNNTNAATTRFVKSVLSGNGYGLATFSKATNGYYLFANGLLIQWGTAYGTIDSTATVSMPTYFNSATAYSITTAGVSSTPSRQSQIVEKWSGSFKVALGNSSVHWIAIGYR